jgi:Tol biopolymer transport system component
MNRRGARRVALAVALAAGTACSGFPAHPGATASHRRPAGPSPAPRNPAVSGLGSLVFVSDRSGREQIYSMSADGHDVRRLTDDTSIDSWPVWSPDGSWIAFASTRDGASDVFVMSADGGAVSRLTSSPGDDYHPTWSPDGRRIAFESTRDGNAEIYAMNADGSHEVRLTRDPALDGSPAWSPDGGLIAFESYRDGDYEIYTMRPDGSNERRLTDAPGEDGSPAWSPDRSEIAFSSARDGQPRLYVMHPDGSDQVPISPPAAGDAGGGTGVYMDAGPAWSRDGAWIAFETTRPGTLEIWAMRPDGTAVVPITTVANNGSPSWE